ncbi:SMP-30/Gluconolactonase/LRE-like region [Methylophilaceae bacterium]
MIKHTLLALLLSVFIPVAQAAPLSTQKISGLKMPESVVQATDGRVFVSEINGFGVDGDGQISVIEAGQVKLFAKGLDDPKGLAIIGQSLYVADNKRILKLALSGPKQGQAEVFAAASAFPVTPLFLNDLEADLAGNLYVSDSGDLKGKGGAVYQINAQGQVRLLISGQQDNRILAPNGLLMDDTGDVLMVVDFASGILYSYNLATKQLLDIAEGFGGGDGVVHHANGSMFVSDWKNGKVFRLDMNGEVTPLAATYQSAADIALTKDEKVLMVPDMKAGELDFIVLP